MSVDRLVKTGVGSGTMTQQNAQRAVRDICQAQVPDKLPGDMPGDLNIRINEWERRFRYEAMAPYADQITGRLLEWLRSNDSPRQIELSSGSDFQDTVTVWVGTMIRTLAFEKSGEPDWESIAIICEQLTPDDWAGIHGRNTLISGHRP